MLLSVLFLTLQPAALAPPDRFGLPACSLPDQQLASRPDYLLCFDSSLHVATWAAHELTPDMLGSPVPLRPHFRHDADLASAYDSDYKFSGFSRGHLVPAADRAFSPESFRSTFLFSNAVPQIQSMNAGSWQKLEAKLRSIAQSADSVIIFTGVLFESDSPAFIGASRVAVPSALFKVALVLRGSEKTMYAAIVPNSENVRQSLDATPSPSTRSKGALTWISFPT